MVTVTANGPVWAMSVTLVSSWPVRRAFFWALKLAANAAPSHGVPLWKVSPDRRVTVHAV